MGIVQKLSALALRQVLPGLTGAIAGQTVGNLVAAGCDSLSRHLSNHSQRYLQALAQAHERAWKALEIGLAGESFWEQCKVFVASGEDKAFRQQVQAFLETNPVPQAIGKAKFRQKCLDELRGARQRKIFFAGSLTVPDLARETAIFLAYAEPRALLAAEQKSIREVVAELQREQCPELAWLLSQQLQAGMPLIVVAYRYFFRRQVEADAELARGLTFSQLDQLTQAQAVAFQGLTAALVQQRQLLDTILARVTGIEDVIVSVAGVQTEHSRKLDQLLQQMQGLAAKVSLDKAVRPGVSIRNEHELQMVKTLLAQFRSLPEADRSRASIQHISLVGKLELETGELGAAEKTFRAVAQSAGETSQKAEAHYNSYRVALEKRDWSIAFQELLNAVRLDGKKFAPFPVGRYHPLRILGAGGFGVVFLCQHKFMSCNVVVKALITDGAEREADKVFSEAQLLTQLNHPAVIRISDCGYADPVAKDRPFLVMDYFDGMTLEQYIELKGPLEPYDLWLLVQQLGEGLQDAHARGIFHRDIKPANILVRKDDEGWEAKIIDFGLALKQDILQISSAARSGHSRSTMDYSITGTLDYAAPEQVGKVHGVPVGPYSDVYSFGKTCCYALFKTTHPSYQHWQKLRKPALAKWIDQLVIENPKDRLADFEAVLDKLPKIKRPGARGKKDSGRAAADTQTGLPVKTATPSSGTPAAQVAQPVTASEKRAFTKVRLVVVRGQKPNVSYVLREGMHVIGRTVNVAEYTDQLMKSLDQNLDGRISREEAAGYRLGQLFDQIDINKDGFVSRVELQSAAAAMFASQSTPPNIDLIDQDAPGKNSCSREHARITVTKTEVLLEDMKSTNGTFVNRTRVNPGEKLRLQDDDIVQLGQIHFRVELD